MAGVAGVARVLRPGVAGQVSGGASGQIIDTRVFNATQAALGGRRPSPGQQLSEDDRHHGDREAQNRGDGPADRELDHEPFAAIPRAFE
jgi:hypothetical protein